MEVLEVFSSMQHLILHWKPKFLYFRIGAKLIFFPTPTSSLILVTICPPKDKNEFNGPSSHIKPLKSLDLKKILTNLQDLMNEYGISLHLQVDLSVHFQIVISFFVSLIVCTFSSPFKETNNKLNHFFSYTRQNI